jgi:hypothetical protein
VSAPRNGARRFAEMGHLQASGRSREAFTRPSFGAALRAIRAGRSPMHSFDAVLFEMPVSPMELQAGSRAK